MVERQKREFQLSVKSHRSFISRAAGKTNALDALLHKVSAESIDKLAAHTHTLIFGKNVNVKMCRVFILEILLAEIGRRSPFVPAFTVAIGARKIFPVENFLEAVKVFGTDYVADRLAAVIQYKAVFRLVLDVVVTKRIMIKLTG